MMDSRRRLTYIIHCCSCLNLSLNQQSLVVREENPLRTFLSCIAFFFLFSFHLSLSVSVSLSVPLCHSPPLSSSSLLSVVERPFHKKRQNILFCLLRSWNDAISTSSCCYSHVFVFVQVATVLHANFQNSKISLNLYFILSVENHTLSTKIKIKGWTTEIFV